VIGAAATTELPNDANKTNDANTATAVEKSTAVFA
jgi:hypothetical protein